MFGLLISCSIVLCRLQESPHPFSHIVAIDVQVLAPKAESVEKIEFDHFLLNAFFPNHPKGNFLNFVEARILLSA